MSYSVCRNGGRMCDGCMECYDRRNKYEDECIVLVEDDEKTEEEEEL